MRAPLTNTGSTGGGGIGASGTITCSASKTVRASGLSPGIKSTLSDVLGKAFVRQTAQTPRETVLPNTRGI